MKKIPREGIRAAAKPYANRRVIEKTISLNKVMIQTTKIVGKSMFGVGLVLSGIDIYQNKGSASSIGLAALDTGMAIVGLVPGFQLLSGAYFAGRIAYQIYEETNK